MDTTKKAVSRAMADLSNADEQIQGLQLLEFRTLAANERADNARRKIGEAMAELDRLLYLETRA